MPRSQPQPFDIKKLVASILEGAKEDEGYGITVADYVGLRGDGES
jgi:hypothetical protein